MCRRSGHQFADKDMHKRMDLERSPMALSAPRLACMMDVDPHDQIADLEARIEALAGTIEGCRKIMLVSKFAIAAGAILTLAMLMGAIRPDLAAISGATAAVLGGIVLLGSNRSTADQALANMKKAEAARAELIDRLELRPVQHEIARDRS
jgi:hypothetical protein